MQKIDWRKVAISGAAATLAAGGLAAPAFLPQAFAEEPQSHLLDRAKDIFPPAFDASKLRKFDIVLDDSVSTEVTHRSMVSKIGFGQRTMVSIMTTPTGTYSSDAITSPNVRYPGIDVSPNPAVGDWFVPSQHRSVRVGTAVTPWGTSTWTSVTTGSVTYFSQSFKPTRRRF